MHFLLTGNPSETSEIQQKRCSQSPTESRPGQSRRPVCHCPRRAPEPHRANPDLQTPGYPHSHPVPQEHVTVPEEQRGGTQYGMCMCARGGVWMYKGGVKKCGAEGGVCKKWGGFE